MNKVKQKPPPKTIPSKVVVKKIKNSQMDIEVYAEVLSDKADNTITGGKTSIKGVGMISDGKGKTFFFTTPSYSYEIKGGLKIITKLNGRAKIKGIFKIQTAYSLKAKPTDTSEYGRGTTSGDENVGNTSLGFHEACHRDDYLRYLKNNSLPTFGGRVGMTEQQYNQAVQSFNTAITKWSTNMDSGSTDEVGYKKSTYDIKGQRK